MFSLKRLGLAILALTVVLRPIVADPPSATAEGSTPMEELQTPAPPKPPALSASEANDDTPLAKTDLQKLTPKVLLRMSAWQDRMDGLEKQIHELRAEIAAPKAQSPTLDLDKQKASLDAMETEYAHLHAKLLLNGVFLAPLEIPLWLSRVAKMKIAQWSGDPESQGAILRPEGAHGPADIKGVIETASDLPAAGSVVRRMLRETEESQKKVEKEIEQSRAEIREREQLLKKREASMAAGGLSSEQIQERMGQDEDDFEKFKDLKNDHIALLLANRDYYRTLKTSATSFGITHGTEVPIGLASIAKGVLLYAAGNPLLGTTYIANGVALVTPLGADYGCWGGQVVVWGPTNPLANGTREFTVATLGPALAKVLFKPGVPKTAKETIEALAKGGAQQITKFEMTPEKTTVRLFNKEGKEAVVLTFHNDQKDAKIVLQDLEAHPENLKTFDLAQATEEVGKMGWDVKDAFRQLVPLAMDAATQKRNDSTGHSPVGFLLKPVMALGGLASKGTEVAYQGVKQGVFRAPASVEGPQYPAFVDHATQGDTAMNFSIKPDQVRAVGEGRQLRAGWRMTTKGLKPVWSFVSPSLADAWQPVGASIEGATKGGEAVIRDVVAPSYSAVKQGASAVARSIAEGPIGRACFASFKLLSVSQIR